MRGTILIVDDEKSQRDILKVILESKGHTVALASSAAQAVSRYRGGGIDIVLTDLKMADTEGLSVVADLLRADPDVCMIIMTAHGSIDSAVEAMKKGAFDYLTKPLDREELLISIDRAFERIALLEKNRHLQQQLEDRFRIENLIGDHPRMQENFRLIRKIAPSTATVLITGESGTGKELAARAIHFSSPRRDKPFMALNASAIPETLIESELFGHERGSFSGAVERAVGLFEAAEGGTLFLDEIGDLPLAMQAKILRVLQEKEIRRIGGRVDIPIDVRVIAATNKNLEEEIRRERFREDLFYRLNGISIHLPPLRERGTDIPVLAKHFLDRYSRQAGSPVRDISRAALRLLMDYFWPGNIRQLGSVIERAVLLCDGEEIGESDLPEEIRRRRSRAGLPGFEIPAEGFSLETFERELLLSAMEKSGWVISRAAKLLGISYKTLQYRLEKFQIRRPEEREREGRGSEKSDRGEPARRPEKTGNESGK